MIHVTGMLNVSDFNTQYIQIKDGYVFYVV